MKTVIEIHPFPPFIPKRASHLILGTFPTLTNTGEKRQRPVAGPATAAQAEDPEHEFAGGGTAESRDAVPDTSLNTETIRRRTDRSGIASDCPFVSRNCELGTSWDHRERNHLHCAEATVGVVFGTGRPTDTAEC